MQTGKVRGRSEVLFRITQTWDSPSDHNHPVVLLEERGERRARMQKAAVHIINFAIVKIICKICIINIIKSLVGETSDMMRVKGSLGRIGL